MFRNYNIQHLGLGFLRKFQQYRRLPQDAPGGSGHHLEEELDRLTGKIDNLLCKIEGQDQEAARGQEEECLVCGINRASMMTLPCSHQVVCRKCFVRTIQMAVAQKRLPLRCIMCRAKVLKIKQNGRASGEHNTATSQQICDESDEGLPKSVSGYNINNNISYSGSSYSFTSGKHSSETHNAHNVSTEPKLINNIIYYNIVSIVMNLQMTCFRCVRRLLREH